MKDMEEREVAAVFGKRFREAIGYLSAGEVAWRLGLEEATVEGYLAGEVVPETEDVVLVSREFKVSIDWLIGLSDLPRINEAEAAYLQLIRETRQRFGDSAVEEIGDFMTRAVHNAKVNHGDAAQFQRYLQHRIETGQVIDQADLRYLNFLRKRKAEPQV